MKISTGLITLGVATIFVLGCKDKAQPVQEPAAKTNESVTGPTSVSTLSTFNKAITEFATKGGSARYEALLSKRMKQKFVDGAANRDDPEFKAEIAIRTKELNIPETSSLMEIAAAMWHKGLEPVACIGSVESRLLTASTIGATIRRNDETKKETAAQHGTKSGGSSTPPRGQGANLGLVRRVQPSA